MKYKIGDKVKCDGGDWWFYGTVSAVFEHSVCPCYRLTIERMEKKSCKFSITQFEFELEPDHVVVDSSKDVRKREPKPEPIPAPTPKKAQIQKKEPQGRKISGAWEKNLDLYLKGDRSYTVYNWITYNRKQYKAGTLSDDKLEKLKEINFSFVFDRKFREKTEKPKPEKVELVQKQVQEQKKEKPEKPEKQIVDGWERNFDLFRKGEKSNAISTWIVRNRKLYKTGDLPEDKFERLLEVDFPFDVVRNKKPDKWDKQLEEWKKGERKSIYVQRWRQRSIRQFLEGKLSADRIAKLKEVGILK